MDCANKGKHDKKEESVPEPVVEETTDYAVYRCDIKHGVTGDFEAVTENTEDFSGFTLLGRRTVDFPVTLSSQDEITALFMMTPFWHRTGDAGRARLASLDHLTVTASAEISLWEAHPCSSPS